MLVTDHYPYLLADTVCRYGYQMRVEMADPDIRTYPEYGMDRIINREKHRDRGISDNIEQLQEMMSYSIV